MVRYIRSRAPLRIGIAGGGTDVDPYASEKGGCVFNTTINKYAYCTLTPREDKLMSVHSLYYGRYQAPLDGGPLKLDGNLDLIKAVANHFGIADGFDMMIQSDAPAGSGLGGSSTMMVALISAVANWLGEEMSSDEIAGLAYHLERVDIGLKGGKQDQYAAAFGGFNLMEMDSNGVKVNPVKVRSDVSNELQCRSLLCYTGISRESAEIIDTQIKAFKRGSNEKALDESKRLAREICEAVRKGDIESAGLLLDESWQYKKQFSDNISNNNINSLYETAMANGAIGGKVSGAGGGGFMYFICRYDAKARVAQELQKQGAVITDFMFDPNGVTSWRINYE
ncbi:MAG: kinase [Candidatus Methanoplasma sp.]|jgi:D-glycero-alpha-D-manno-heptose-7-phosphate kinase|nr:kinase [Candidatus Methanoplasma sp.]